MSAEREKMIAALEDLVVPALRAKGFKGSFPHFRRRTQASIHLLTFQFNKHGGSFVVEVASCSMDGRSPIWEADIKAHDLPPSARLRLGSSGPNSDHWFKFDSLLAWNRYEREAKAILPFLNGQAEDWWNHPLGTPALNRDSDGAD